MSIFPASRSRLRERGVGLLAALLLNALMLLALFTISPELNPLKKEERNLVSFDLVNSQNDSVESSKAEKSEKKQTAQTTEKQKTQVIVKQAMPVDKPVEMPPTPELPFLTLTRDQMASADIGKMPRKDTGAGQGKGDSSKVSGPGAGPGGVQLYAAEWYRPPTSAELGTYIPANAPPEGWGLVACKPIERFHVENCQVLAEYPQGSGFGRAVRLAAWQFLVRPPRENNTPIEGAWVRIRIDYTRTGARVN